jgi:hypothetical protein
VCHSATVRQCCGRAAHVSTGIRLSVIAAVRRSVQIGPFFVRCGRGCAAEAQQSHVRWNHSGNRRCDVVCRNVVLPLVSAQARIHARGRISIVKGRRGGGSCVRTECSALAAE